MKFKQIAKVVGTRTVTIVCEAEDGTIRVNVHTRSGNGENYYLPLGYVLGSSTLEYQPKEVKS